MQLTAIRSLTVALAVMLVMVGCRLAPFASRVAATAPQMQAAPITLAVTPPQVDAERFAAASDGTGTLKFLVRWPNALAASAAVYRAQQLPDSTAKIAVTVKNGSTTVGSATIARSPGEATASAFIKLKVASGLDVTVKAQPATTVADGTACSQDSHCGTGSACSANQCVTRTLASSTATVTIVNDQTTSLTVTLAPQFTPTVSGFNPTSVSTGGTLTITGTNFRPSFVGSAKPTVTFTRSGGGTTTAPAGDITVTSDTQISVVVPDDAVTGNVVVTQDGVASSVSSVTVTSGPTVTGSSSSAGQIGESLTISVSGVDFASLTSNPSAIFFATGGASVSAVAYPSGGTSLVTTVPFGAVDGQIYLRINGVDYATGINFDVDTTSVAAPSPTPAPAGVLGSTFSVIGSMPTTLAAAASIRAGNKIFIIGGSTDWNNTRNTIFEANIDINGTIGAFTTSSRTLVTARAQHGAEVIGNYVYVIGGSVGSRGGSSTTNIERATLNADGSLGTFSNYGNLALGRANFTTLVTGPYLYVIGGTNFGDGDSTTVQRAAINADGSLGAFSDMGPSVRLQAARMAHAGFRVGNFYYVLGGYNAYTNIERATIDANGVMSTFSNYSRSLSVGRNRHSVIALAGRLYLLGGYDNGFLTSIDSASIGSDGELGAFGIVGSTALAVAVEHGIAHLTQNGAYYFGGNGGFPSVRNTIQRAVIQ